jgi:transcriptional regulator
MYIPAHYKIEDAELTRQFISEYNFGLLLCNGKSVPVATHLPFYMQEKGEELFLVTHLAKANPQAKALENGTQALVIFNGPHGYVSPSLYTSPQNVPTWNYMSVHVAGTAEVIGDENEMRPLMHLTIQGAEKEFEKQYNSLAPEYLNAMYKAIVFVRVKINGIETKFKLSQNKREQDIKRVADRFEEQGNSSLAEWMRKINKV